MNQLHSTAVALPYPRHLERPEPFSQRPVNDHSSVHPPRGAFDLRDGEALRLREELHFLHHGRTPPISLGFIGPQDSLIPTVPESLESRRDYHAQIFSRREGARASGKLDPHIEEGKHHAKRANLGSHNSFITYQWPSSEHESEVRRLGKRPISGPLCDIEERVAHHSTTVGHHPNPVMLTAGGESSASSLPAVSSNGEASPGICRATVGRKRNASTEDMNSSPRSRNGPPATTAEYSSVSSPPSSPTLSQSPTLTPPTTANDDGISEKSRRNREACRRLRQKKIAEVDHLRKEVTRLTEENGMLKRRLEEADKDRMERMQREIEYLRMQA